jgi:hypothetical protein
MSTFQFEVGADMQKLEKMETKDITPILSLLPVLALQNCTAMLRCQIKR